MHLNAWLQETLSTWKFSFISFPCIYKYIFSKYILIFTKTFNPNHFINLNKFTRSLENVRSSELMQCFQIKTVQVATRQPKILRKILTKAKFEENTLPPPVKEVGFFPCNDCIYHRHGSFKTCKFVQFKVNDKSLIWHYKHYFSCDSIMLFTY